LALALCIAACATTRRTRGVAPHGFLGNYADLEQGTKGEAQLVYFDEGADWAGYNAIVLDSVTVWHHSDAAKLPEKDQQRLTDLFFRALHEQLSRDYAIVERAGPGVMRLRAAITEVKSARVVGNTLTTVLPPARLLSTILGRATNVQAWVGTATVEVEITDTLTGQRLAAIVDERSGATTLRGIGGQWKDVDNAFRWWAERLRKRLQELRSA
jgi:hypothetical protein